MTELDRLYITRLQARHDAQQAAIEARLAVLRPLVNRSDSYRWSRQMHRGLDVELMRLKAMLDQMEAYAASIEEARVSAAKFRTNGP